MVKWIKLENFGCPSCSCSSGINWICKRDDEALWLNEFGEIRCSSADHSDKVINWKWSCGNKHCANYEGTKADFEGFVFSLSQSTKLMEVGGSQWVASLLIELGKQYAA